MMKRRTSLVRSCVTLVLILGCAFSTLAKSLEAKSWSVKWQPARLVNGSPVIFRVASPIRLSALSGEWLGHSVPFVFDASTGLWRGFAGVSLATSAGTHVLKLKGTTYAGESVVSERDVTTVKGKYHNVTIRVPKQFTEPTPEQLQIISKDKATKEILFAEVTPDAQWLGSFRVPVVARVSDVFGTTRTFNGKVQSVHQGLDYAVSTGTPVGALNTGTVLLARPLYFEGNCVVINHGQGLLTLYLHLSELKVKEGETVERGQVLGLSGGTGRATGPHLHVAVRWQGVYLDPATLLSLRLPETPSANSKAPRRKEETQ